MKSSQQRLGYSTTTTYSVGKGQVGGQAPTLNWSQGASHSSRGHLGPAWLIGDNLIFCCGYTCCLADRVVCTVVASSESFTRLKVMRRRCCHFSALMVEVLWASWTCETWWIGDTPEDGYTYQGKEFHIYLLITYYEFCLPVFIRFRVFLNGSYITASLW